MEEKQVAQIVSQVLASLESMNLGRVTSNEIPVGVSNRHIHLTQDHIEILFGPNYRLQPMKDLAQKGEYAAKETVSLVGPKGVLAGVRVLGPARSHSQVEISRTDSFTLGISAPLRDSGDLSGAADIMVVASHGAVHLKEGAIVAARHIHLSPLDAKELGVCDRQEVDVAIGGERGGQLSRVRVRVGEAFCRELHVDTDEANGLGLKNGDVVTIV